MAESSGLKFDLSLHLENLIPGVACVWALSNLSLPETIQTSVASLSNGSNLAIPALLAVSYMFGIFAHVSSRLVIDSLSEAWFPRAQFLLYFATNDLNNQWYGATPKNILKKKWGLGQIANEKKAPVARNSKQAESKQTAVQTQDNQPTDVQANNTHTKRAIRDDINKTYSSTLRKVLSNSSPEVKLEVGRRRERGRMIRTSLVPVLFWLLSIFNQDCFAFLLVLLIPAAFFLILILYGYSELMVFEECCLGLAEEQAESVISYPDYRKRS